MSGEFNSFLREHGIISQLSTSRTPQQNGVVERKKLNFDLYIVTYIFNLVPSKLVPTTLLEMWSGHKHSLHHNHIWGCPTRVLKKQANKLEFRSDVYLFVGYLKGTRGFFYFYSPIDQKVFVSTNARFLEENYMANKEIWSDIGWSKTINEPVIIRTIHDLLNQIPSKPVDSSTPPKPHRRGRIIWNEIGLYYWESLLRQSFRSWNWSHKLWWNN